MADLDSARSSPGTADMRATYARLCKELLDLNESIGLKLDALEENERRWSETMANAARDVEHGKETVKFNVGGRVFETSRSTLLQGEHTYFHALLSNPGQWQPREKDGAYFIDRDPKLFKRIFAAVRDQEPVDTSDLGIADRKRLRIESDYFQLPQAQTLCWDPESCGRHLCLSEQCRAVTKVSGGTASNAAVVGKHYVDRFKVRVELKPGDDVVVGFTNPLGFNGNKKNYTREGSYNFSCIDGRLYAGNGDNRSRGVGAAAGALSGVSVIEARLDRGASSIYFSVDGIEHPSSFADVSCEGLVPCVEIFDQGARVTLDDSAW